MSFVKYQEEGQQNARQERRINQLSSLRTAWAVTIADNHLENETNLPSDVVSDKPLQKHLRYQTFPFIFSQSVTADISSERLCIANDYWPATALHWGGHTPLWEQSAYNGSIDEHKTNSFRVQIKRFNFCPQLKNLCGDGGLSFSPHCAVSHTGRGGRSWRN